MLDVREFFHCHYSELQDDEFIAILNDLIARPDSRYGAIQRGWKWRATRAEMIAMDQFDAQVQAIRIAQWAASGKQPKKIQPYPRPWDEEKKKSFKTVHMTKAAAEKFWKNMVKVNETKTDEEIQAANRKFVQQNLGLGN